MSDLIREALENLVRQQDGHPRSLEKLRRQGLSPDHPTVTATMEGHRLMMDRAWQQAREAISRTPYPSTRQQEVGTWLLYEHEDGRHAVAPTAAAATFAHGDPAWHRVGPVEVPWSMWPSNGRRFYEALRSADPVEFPDEWADLTPTWRSGMEQAARTYGVGGNERVSHQRQTQPYRSAAGDTLASIAQAELRDMNRWPEILTLNTHVLDGAAGPASKPRAGTLLTLPSPSTARQQEVGSGWKLVPMEPTQEMLRAGLSVHEFGWCEASEDISECGVLTEAGITQADADAINAESMTQQAEIYRAMLAAAPSTPEKAGGVPACVAASPAPSDDWSVARDCAVCGRMATPGGPCQRTHGVSAPIPHPLPAQANDGGEQP